MPASDAGDLAAIRARLRLSAPARHGGVAFGDPLVDACLPPEGLALGAVHEVMADTIEAETGTLAAAFACVWLARLRLRPGAAADQRPVLWIADRMDLYPAGLLAYGLDPARLLLVQSGGEDGERGTLAAMEAALRGGAALAVVGEAGRVSRLAGRRLHLACLAHGSTALLLRRWPHGRKAASRDAGPAAAVATRWRLAPAPSPHDGREPGAPRWQVALLHARGGRPGAWLMQVDPIQVEHADASVSLRVVAGLADLAAAPIRQRRAG